MSSQAQCEKCCAALIEMLTDNTHWGQFMIGPISDAEKIIKTQLSEIVADHFSSKTGTNLEIPEKKSRGRPAGSPNSSPSIADIRSSLKELGLSTSGKKAELKNRLAEAESQDISSGKDTSESNKTPESSKKTKKDKKDKNDKKKVEEPTKKGLKKGGPNKRPSKTKKNTAAAIVIQSHARTLLAKKIAKNLTFAYSPSSKFISAMSDLYKEQSKKTNTPQ